MKICYFQDFLQDFLQLQKSKRLSFTHIYPTPKKKSLKADVVSEGPYEMSTT